MLGNLIGTQKDGKSGLGNAQAGVEITDSSANLVGKNVLGMANTIAFNAGDGVRVSRLNTTIETSSNSISNNSIFSNGGLGIDLAGGFENTAGATDNDAGDADLGANQLQNKLVLTSATTSADGIIIKDKLNSTPNLNNFTVQFFSSPSGNEGKKFIGQTVVSTNSGGDATFNVIFDVAVPAGHKITATATDPSGNTFEFSAPRTVVAQ